MISPHTPPGTWVVYIRKLRTREDFREVFRHPYSEYARSEDGSSNLGRRFCVAEIVPCKWTKCGFAVRMEGWDSNKVSFLECYSPATLPDSLTSLLVGKPVKEDA